MIIHNTKDIHQPMHASSLERNEINYQRRYFQFRITHFAFDKNPVNDRKEFPRANIPHTVKILTHPKTE